ncbi:MAG: ABC transporter permease [Actinomycetia bacterium]|nr:ABC transporter permease [Actinomycetes bacterium]MCP4957820.1 ABC transporter permease [Actinomycetes bacterium]
MTAVAETPTSDRTPGLIERYTTLPAWLRWMLITGGAMLVVAIVQEISGTEGLTTFRSSQGMLKWSIPLLLSAMGGLLSERAGVVNIGLDGIMAVGMWCGAWGAYNYGAWGGLLAAAAGGALVGLLHAVATITFRVDHIVSGVAILILGPGLTRYLSERVFVNYPGGSQTQSPRVDGLGNVTVPFLAGGKIGDWRSPDFFGWFEKQDWFWISDIAGVLKGLMLQVAYFTLLSIALTLVLAWLLWRTRTGLRLRSAGENPWAGESLGINIYFYKYLGVVMSGALAGLSGAFIALELANIYRGGTTNGRGFIALAVMIFGNYRVRGIVFGALLFAYPFSLALTDFDGKATRALLLVIALALAATAAWAIRRQRIVDAAIAAAIGLVVFVWYLFTDAAPAWLPDSMPYAIVLLVLIFNFQKLRMPKADGQHYRRGEH